MITHRVEINWTTAYLKKMYYNIVKHRKIILQLNIFELNIDKTVNHVQ